MWRGRVASVGPRRKNIRNKFQACRLDKICNVFPLPRYQAGVTDDEGGVGNRREWDDNRSGR